MPVRLRHQPGERLLEGLEIVEVLGSGAHGTAYRCRDLNGGVDRTVKEMHLFLDPLEAARGRVHFAREARCLARLNHPLLPKLQAVTAAGPWHASAQTGLPTTPDDADAVAVEERIYLVSEYAPGVTLEALAQRWRAGERRPDGRTVVGWLEDLAGVLGYLHTQGLVHRDVKPANILIRDLDDLALLLDFGLLHEVGRVAGYGTVPLPESGRVGTPGYAPPDPVEQEHPGPASDLHALAMTARRALTALDPTRPEELQTLREKSLNELRPDLEAHVAAALDRAIQPAAEDRWESMARFLEALKTPSATVVPRANWLVVRPEAYDVGPVAPGQLRDFVLSLKDRRPGVRPRGYANSDDDRLRFLEPAMRGDEVELRVLLKVPRGADEGPVRTRVTVTTDDEARVIPVTYVVDPNARRMPGGAGGGCALLPLAILRGD